MEEESRVIGGGKKLKVWKEDEEDIGMQQLKLSDQKQEQKLFGMNLSKKQNRVNFIELNKQRVREMSNNTSRLRELKKKEEVYRSLNTSTNNKMNDSLKLKDNS